MSGSSSKLNSNLKVSNLDDQKQENFTFSLEIQERIISFCDVRTIYLLMRTCNHFSKLCKENQIWKLILKNFGIQDEAFDFFDGCRMAVSYFCKRNSTMERFFLCSRQTLIFYESRMAFLPFLVCNDIFDHFKSHKILFIGEKIFIGLKNALVMIYEFDSYSMTLLSCIPYSLQSHQCFGEFMNDSYLVIPSLTFVMVIERKEGELRLEEALEIQVQNAYFDSSTNKLFYIQDKMLNCMFFNGSDLVTIKEEIPFNRVEFAILRLEGLFVFIVVKNVVILIFKKSNLQFLRMVPITSKGDFLILSSLILFEPNLVYNIFKDEYFRVNFLGRSGFAPMRRILSKFNLPISKAIDERGNYLNDEDRCIIW